MCCEDRKMAREDQAHYEEVPIGVTNTPIVSASPNRIGLIFTAPVAGTLHATPKQDATPGCGLQAGPAMGDIYLTLENNGPIVKQAWYGNIPGGASTILVIETMDGEYCE